MNKSLLRLQRLADRLHIKGNVFFTPLDLTDARWRLGVLPIGKKAEDARRCLNAMAAAPKVKK